jgi:hypothetical protein
VRRRLLFPLALLGALFLATSAYAGSRDRNHDRLPDRWEQHHHLSLKVKQTHRDQDRDGLDNMAEWRSHTDPRDRDSDDDGIKDATENAGKISAFDGTTLTIKLFDDGELTGKVTDATEIKCENERSASTSSNGDDGGSGDDQGEDGASHDQGDDHGDDGNDDHGDHHGGRDDSCPADALKVGAAVQEADLKVTSAGRIWDELELR